MLIQPLGWQGAENSYCIRGPEDLAAEPGTCAQAFLALAFGVEAFLMTAHKKHEALDATVHFLLALTMWACTLCTLSELFARHSVLPTAGRALSCMMQGMWLIQVFSCQLFHAVNTSWCWLLMASSLFCTLNDMVGIKRG